MRVWCELGIKVVLETGMEGHHYIDTRPMFQGNTESKFYCYNRLHPAEGHLYFTLTIWKISQT